MPSDNKHVAVDEVRNEIDLSGVLLRFGKMESTRLPCHLQDKIWAIL